MSGKGWWNNAISGLESRLDTILTEDGQGKPVDSGSAGGAGSVNGVGGVSNTRNSSRSRPNSRLQDRLAKAVAVNKGTGVGTGTGNGERPDEEAISASVSVSASPRPSLDIQQPTSIPTPSMSIPSIVTPQPASPQHSVDSNLSRPSMDMDKDTGKDTSTPAGPDDTSEPSTRDPDLLLAELSALQEAHEQTIRGHHDELNAHLERIDALQSKLTYLAQQLTTSAKATTDDTDTTPADRKLAEKDMRISSLMEEGQRLSKTEMKHLTTVKTLRAKALDHNKDIATLKQRLSKAEKSITEQSERAKRAEAADRAAQEKLKILAKIETDLQLIQEEREEAGMTIAELRKQLSDALSRAETAEQRVQTGALEAEKRVTASLKEDLENLRIEKKLAEDRAKREIQNSKDEAKSQEERAKIVELELRGEIIVRLQASFSMTTTDMMKRTLNPS
ncbi:TATA element modulatory factor 1 DNA binding-domain-containing protein [Phaeosphaeriaceae sp. PMI808]|nr:TATA element modulatory factor 1 DNA binding-domain-containing protein [Phaeosphaeriaceae sp. PMI808]